MNSIPTIVGHVKNKELFEDCLPVVRILEARRLLRRASHTNYAKAQREEQLKEALGRTPSIGISQHICRFRQLLFSEIYDCYALGIPRQFVPMNGLWWTNVRGDGDVQARMCICDYQEFVDQVLRAVASA